MNVCSAEEAKSFICYMTGVTSRRQLDDEPWAKDAWDGYIRKPYRDYLIKKGIA